MRRATLFVLFALLTLFIPRFAEAQQVDVTGKVIDPEGNPVPYATVILSTDSLSLKNAQYAVATNEGTFRIANVSQSPSYRWIAVKSVGYSNFLAKRPTQALKKLTVTLEPLTESIDQVVVKGKARDIIEKEDTVVYNVNYFRKGNEKNLAEVVKNMPGMKVDAGGNVSYKGKTIGKVLVNGKDVLPTASGSALKTLPADFAKSLEVLTDYTDGDIAKDFQPTENIALNLKTEKAFKVTGNIEAGGGIFNKFYGKGSLITLSPAISASLLASGNNTGHSLLRLTDFFNQASGGLGALIESKLETGINAVVFSLSRPPANLYSNISGMGNLNVTWTPTATYRLKSNSIYSKSFREGGSFQKTFYNLGAGASFDKQTQSQQTQSPQLFSQAIEQRWIATRRLSFRAETFLNYVSGNQDEEYLSHYPGERIRAIYKGNDQSIKFRQDFGMLSLIERGLLAAILSVDYTNSLSDNVVGTSKRLLNPSLFPWSYQKDSLYNYTPTEKKDELLANAVVGYTYPLPLRGLFAKAELSYTFTYEKAASAFVKIDFYEEKSIQHAPKLYLGLMKNKGIARFGGGLFLAAYHHQFSPELVATSWKLALEPVLRLRLKFSSNNSLTLNASRKLKPLRLTDLTRRYWIDSYDAAWDPSSVTIGYSDEISANIAYKYSSQFYGVYFFPLFYYTRYANIAQTRTVYRNDLLFMSKMNGGQMDMWGFNAYFSKAFSVIPFTVDLIPRYHSTWSRSVQGDEQQYMAQHSLNLDLKIKSTIYRSPVNFALSANYLFAFSDLQPENFQADQHYVTGKAEIFLTIKDFFFSVGGNVDYQKNTSVQDRWVYDLESTIRYSWKHFTLELTGSRLLHLRRFEWTGQTLSSYIRTTTFYRRMPGYVLLTLSYQV